MAFKLAPVPEDESWACLPCGNHAEVMDIDDLREAQRKFAALS